MFNFAHFFGQKVPDIGATHSAEDLSYYYIFPEPVQTVLTHAVSVLLQLDDKIDRDTDTANLLSTSFSSLPSQFVWMTSRFSHRPAPSFRKAYAHTMLMLPTAGFRASTILTTWREWCVLCAEITYTFAAPSLTTGLDNSVETFAVYKLPPLSRMVSSLLSCQSIGVFYYPQGLSLILRYG